MPVFYLKPDKGIINWSNKRALFDYLLAVDGKELYANIDKVKGVRSLDQNAWLWSCVYRVIGDHCGITENEVHDIMKRKFLNPDFIMWKGEQVKVPGSTTKLDKISFGEYVERIRAEVADMGITIPDPN